jgi:hypothetical protein
MVTGFLISVVAISAFSVTKPGSQAVGLAGTKPKPIALTNEQIQSALIAVNDFPTGWSSYPIPPEQNVPSATEGICNGPNELARAQNKGSSGQGRVAFTSNPSQGPLVSESLYSFPSDRQAKAYMKATTDQASACSAPWQTSPPPGAPSGTTTRVTIAGLSFPKVAGDQVLALRETETEQLNGQDLTTLTIDLVELRKGNHVLLVAFGGTSPDVNQLQTYVRKAYSKFGVALQNARHDATKKAS